MYKHLKPRLEDELEDFRSKNLYKEEHVLASDQAAEILLSNGYKAINFSSNNYLGLANHPKVISAADQTMINRGFGLASGRFICGTQDIHKELESKVSSFLGTEDSLLYASAFDANIGIFEPLLNQEDVILSDELNHASIKDGIRLCSAKSVHYKHNDMTELEQQLINHQNARTKVIVTNGVFSLDGTIAKLDKIVDLAEKYNAITMIDECHATGIIGKEGRGTHEHCDVIGKIDIITGTFGKALGGGSGGFTSGKKEIISLLRQKSRPYLYSNTLAPAIVGASIKVFELIEKNSNLRDKLHANTSYFRSAMNENGFDIKPGTHPIVPVMFYKTELAKTMAERLLEEGIYVISFSHPVVPENQARIRVQMSVAHDQIHLNKAIAAFTKVGKEMGVIS